MYDQLLKSPSLPVSDPTSSYWQSPAHEKLQNTQSAGLPARRDIVIIGSGITGCSVAHELLQHDDSGSIAVLEARSICSGATGRNGGRINCVAVLDYDKYRRKFGDEAARAIVRFEMTHLDEIVAAAKSMGAELYQRSEVRETQTVAAVFSDAMLQDFKMMLVKFEEAFPEWKGRWRVVTEEVQTKYGIRGAAGALIGTAGASWPYRLITGLFETLLHKHKDRLTLESHTPVTAISRDSSGGGSSHPYTILTPRGVIRAKHVVHCTNGHAAHLLPSLRGILVPRRGQMTVQSPGRAFPDTKGRRSWSFYFDSCFDYLQQNEHTGEIFIGGGDLGGLEGGLEVFGVASDAGESVTAKAHLAGVLPVVFGGGNSDSNSNSSNTNEDRWGPERPGIPLLKASWSGIMCNSLDGVPVVGMLSQTALGRASRQAGTPRDGAEWISAGYAGYGMVNAWRSGKAVARQILGHEVPAWLPRPYRISNERMEALSDRLAHVVHSEKHLRALL